MEREMVRYPNEWLSLLIHDIPAALCVWGPRQTISFRQPWRTATQNDGLVCTDFTPPVVNTMGEEAFTVYALTSSLGTPCSVGASSLQMVLPAPVSLT